MNSKNVPKAYDKAWNMIENQPKKFSPYKQRFNFSSTIGGKKSKDICNATTESTVNLSSNVVLILNVWKLSFFRTKIKKETQSKTS